MADSIVSDVYIGTSLLEQFNSFFDFFDAVDKDLMFQVIIGFVTVMYVWETYLSFRQYSVQRKHTQVPQELVGVIEQETFSKSRVYALDKACFSFVQGLYSQLEAYAILYAGALPFVWNLSKNQLASIDNEWLHGEIPTSILFVMYFIVYSTITGLPWNIYFTFVLEEKHGFNKQTFGFFVKDNIKKVILSVCLTVPILSLLIYIIQWGGEYFFIYAWLFTTIVALLMVTIYADYIAPLFDTYVPLPEGQLRDQIEELAASLKFPLYKLYVVEGSKRSSHSNAYMYGFGKNKRIVLFDSLIEGYQSLTPKDDTATTEEDTKPQEETPKGCSNAEITAILAHELGHWKLNHNIKNIFISNVNTFFYFLIFAVLMNRQVFYAAFGFESDRPVFIGLIIILQFIFAPYNEVVQFLMTQLTRRFEFQADAFAKELGKTQHLKTGLVKLYKDNLSFPLCDWLYSTWHYSHPPLLERLRALDDKYKSD